MAGRRNRPDAVGLYSEVGLSGAVIFLSVIVLVAVVTTVFATIRPPSIGQIEREIWVDWAHLTSDSTGFTLVDQIVEGRQAAARERISAFGRLIEDQGERFVIPTSVRSIRILTPDGEAFADWRSPLSDSADKNWNILDIELSDPDEGVVGSLEVGYKFYVRGVGGTGSFESISRLLSRYHWTLWPVSIVATIVLVGLVAYLSRVRERAGRLRAQAVTLELAHQMCHELRNGLWAFSLEGRNLRQLFQTVEDYFRAEPEALEAARKRLQLSDADNERFLRAYRKSLTAQGVDPGADVLPCAEMAKESYQQIESFSRYINLTVEELDRNLLGTRADWDPTLMRLSDAWKEACDLLEMRFRSAGVAHRDRIDADDDLVIADRRALVHIFVNLAKNAIEAMRDTPPPRVLEVEIGVDASRVLCALRNRGKTIAPNDLPHIFRRGFSTKHGAGRGTGLALVEQSVRQLDGAITVTSDNADGTCVSLSFPKAG